MQSKIIWKSVKAMLYRKIGAYIEEHLKSDEEKILLIEGARQIGKSYIVRSVGGELYENFVEINFVEDDQGERIFKEVRSTEEFYLKLSMVAGARLDSYENTLVFIDEIQQYPQFLTLLKFLKQERRFRFIGSGSLLGIALKGTVSAPAGSVIPKKMYQLDFEEFLMANSFGMEALEYLRESFELRRSLPEEVHAKVLGMFKRYLLVGGMPDAVNEYLATNNIVKVREAQEAVSLLYGIDASRYEEEAARKLHVRRIYDMIPSRMENVKKRIVAKDIQSRKGDRLGNYAQEFEYLIDSGIAIAANAVSNPKYPLAESQQKNLLKLYMNDVGMLTSRLYQYNVRPVLEDTAGINLGSAYESVVAQELKAHYGKLFYYDNKRKGEVDFIVDDPGASSVLPIEVKSGKDYVRHSALRGLTSNPEYRILSAIVFSNNREIKTRGNILYLPIYHVMFMGNKMPSREDLYF